MLNITGEKQLMQRVSGVMTAEIFLRPGLSACRARPHIKAGFQHFS